MERLTTEFEGYSVPKEFIEVDKYDITAECKDCFEICEEANNNCKECAIQRCFNKLAEYEDAEEKGLLVILPVMPGETVYLIDNNTNACDECEKFHRGEHCDYCEKYNVLQDCFFPQCAEEPMCEKQFLEVIEYKTNQKWILENKDDFGKSIFLTREEAEAALKKIQEEKQ